MDNNLLEHFRNSIYLDKKIRWVYVDLMIFLMIKIKKNLKNSELFDLEEVTSQIHLVSQILLLLQISTLLLTSIRQKQKDKSEIISFISWLKETADAPNGRWFKQQMKDQQLADNSLNNCLSKFDLSKLPSTG